MRDRAFTPTRLASFGGEGRGEGGGAAAAMAAHAAPPPHPAFGRLLPLKEGEKEERRIGRARVVTIARSWLGTPYVHQASAKGQGADCLGLVRGLYTELYGRDPEAPPPYTPDWNERRPCEEPLLAAARRHLVECALSSPSLSSFPLSPLLGGEGRGEGGSATRTALATPPPHPAFGHLLPLKKGEKEEILRPAQILIFRIVKTGPARHCGVVSAQDVFIHAYAGRAVVESWLCRWWIERIAGVFEFPGVEE